MKICFISLFLFWSRLIPAMNVHSCLACAVARFQLVERTIMTFSLLPIHVTFIDVSFRAHASIKAPL